MDNLTSNYTVSNYSGASTVVDAPGFIAFNVLMVVVCIIPVAILNVSVLVAFVVDKVTPVEIRFILANFLIVGLVMLFLLTLEHLTALVLVTTNDSVPSLEFCSVILWALFGAGALRLTLTATFSIVVFIMVRKGIKSINKIALVVSIIILWVVCFFQLNIALLAIPTNNAYVANVACLPAGEVDNNDYVFAVLYIFLFGVIPLLVSITMPVAIFIYILKHKSTESSITPFLKAMAKLSSLLIFGGLINFIGQCIPVVISLVAFSVTTQTVSGMNVFYASLTLFNLSLWPTPILILIFVKSLNARIKKMLLFSVSCHHHTGKQPSASTTLSTEKI